MAGYQLITATPWTRGKAFITAVVAFAFVCGLLIGYAVYSNLNTDPTSGKVFIRLSNPSEAGSQIRQFEKKTQEKAIKNLRIKLNLKQKNIEYSKV